MNEYESYQVTLQPKSAAITPLQSDTIFGHIAWAIRYVKGETELLDFLKAFQDGKDAPLLVSDGFPQGMLPKPIFKALQLSRVIEIIDNFVQSNNIKFSEKDQTQIQKSLKKQSHLKIESIEKIQESFSSTSLLEVALEEIDWKSVTNRKTKNGKASKTETIVMYHNTVNRIYNQVKEGFYQQATRFYADDFCYDVYLKTNYFDEQALHDLFQFIEIGGYGRDKSTGKGRFKIILKKGYNLPEIDEANAFMSLSHYVPNSKAPKNGYYRLMTKYGRLGGDFAKSIIPGIEELYDSKEPKPHPSKKTKIQPHPYKKPVIMMQPGSVFWGKPQLNYGLLLGGKDRAPELRMHKYPHIRHYAYAFPLDLKIVEEEVAA